MQFEFMLFEFIFWLIIIIIFVGICIGISRDCNKISQESRRGRSRQYTVSPSRRQAQRKREAHRTQTHIQYAPIQLTMCAECEATILAEATICPHCNAPQPVCIVCQSSLVPLDSTLRCPHCHGRAHRIHFLEFLKVKGVCPNCNEDLDPHELIDDADDEAPTVSVGPQHLCIVCKTAIGSNDATLQCPHCGGKAHRVHFLEYLKVKGTCPHCQASLDSQDLLTED
ncbi:MAG: hypothetical protein ACFFCJ_03015 [Promethearchaeota archaeon]